MNNNRGFIRKNKKLEMTKIMVFGTFDALHPGHLYFFKQARKLAQNPYLIVSVARDKNVQRIKGRKPWRNEKERLLIIKKNPLVNKAVLGSKEGYLNHIIKENPQIIALGHDQQEYTHNLKEDLCKSGLKVRVKRLKAYKRAIYRSSLMKPD